MNSNTRNRFKAYTSPANGDAQRKRELGHIHQGRQALGWSDDDYRYHLDQQTGATSSATLDSQGRAKILAHMAKLGFIPKASTFKPFDQDEKIKWLWKKLGEVGGLRDCSAASLLAFIARTTGTGYADIKFIPTSDASRVIEALKSMLDRAKRSQKIKINQ